MRFRRTAAALLAVATAGTAAACAHAGTPGGVAAPGWSAAQDFPKTKVCSTAACAHPGSMGGAGPGWSAPKVFTDLGSGMFHSVSATGANNIWMLGGPAGKRYLVHFDGSSWYRIGYPPEADTHNAYAPTISGGCGNAWLTVQFINARDRLWRWHGGVWQEAKFQAAEPNFDLTTGGCGNTWLSTYGKHHGDLWRFRHGSWQRWRDPNPDPLAAVGEHTMFATGRDFLGRLDGSRWAKYPLPRKDELDVISALGRNNFWITVDYPVVRVVHWDGDRWSETPLPSADPHGFYSAKYLAHFDPKDVVMDLYVDEIAGAAPDNVYAIANAGLAYTAAACKQVYDDLDNGCDIGAHQFTVLVHWNGHHWSPVKPGQDIDVGGSGENEYIASSRHGGAWVIGSETMHYIAPGGAELSVTPSGSQSMRIVQIAPVPGTDRVLGIGKVSTRHGPRPAVVFDF